MTETTTQFRSKRERAGDVDLLAKYSAIGIAAIAAANQSFRGSAAKKVEIRRPTVEAYAD
ncbi:hypothetical protein Sa4125_13890 [Aureimonas sp. SA4125]|uniref:hypothetical protein n=1 Tax=Aureimonas sp. SA4125 TaxID=2826993 RepID=UPI001CC5326C|nr:hypothetical protein [Aureimonas sp. SA4125]BDA83847.1 hypothetical protein Sa4125_13890 [Aureimonas sp. SA4125]